MPLETVRKPLQEGLQWLFPEMVSFTNHVMLISFCQLLWFFLILRVILFTVIFNGK